MLRVAADGVEALSQVVTKFVRVFMNSGVAVNWISMLFESTKQVSWDKRNGISWRYEGIGLRAVKPTGLVQRSFGSPYQPCPMQKSLASDELRSHRLHQSSN